jgi:disulfide bond formation protein DsbB
MSQQTENLDSQLANFAGLVLVLSLIIIFVLVSSNGSPVRSVSVSPTDDDAPIVVQLVPTDTAQATVTPLSPTATATSRPTDTPIPTATSRPSNTPEPTAAGASQADIDNQQDTGSVTENVYEPALVAQGETLFVQCAACHGPDARGITNLGKDLVESEFVAGHSDQELLDFIKIGRPIWDPENTTGIDMPPKGGNPALSDEDILAILAYVRSLPGSSE